MGNAKSPQYFGKDLEAMSFAKNYHAWILSEFAPYLGKRVAEIGAGTGSFSHLLLQSGIEHLEAFEPSKNMFPLLQSALEKDPRAKTHQVFFQGQEYINSFDALCYVNVLEHIDDDLQELSQARQALRDNGHLLIFVPALQWLFSKFDKKVGHFRRYDKSSLAHLVGRAGYSLVSTKYFDIAGILPWYINFVLLKNTLGGGSVSLYDRGVVPIMRIVEGLWPAPVGKNILLIAKKS